MLYAVSVGRKDGGPREGSTTSGGSPVHWERMYAQHAHGPGRRDTVTVHGACVPERGARATTLDRAVPAPGPTPSGSHTEGLLSPPAGRLMGLGTAPADHLQVCFLTTSLSTLGSQGHVPFQTYERKPGGTLGTVDVQAGCDTHTPSCQESDPVNWRTTAPVAACSSRVRARAQGKWAWQSPRRCQGKRPLAPRTQPWTGHMASVVPESPQAC